jgi:glutamine synthetase
VAGLLVHAREICAVTNQWVNSYKRLVSGYEAPVYICWAHRHRSALVRVPMYKPGKEKATRVELRSPDPACNPYLAFSVMLAAGLDGIRRDLDLPPDVTDNIYEMSEAERTALGIEQLPESLNEAVNVMEKSDLVREALGDQVFEWFIRNKRIEWQDYRTRVTAWEHDSYMAIL